MSTGTAIVNTNNMGTTPDAVVGTDYTITPPEVQAYLAGEVMVPQDIAIVSRWYFEQGIPVPAPVAPLVEAKPASRHVSRKKEQPAPAKGILHATLGLVDALPEEDKEAVFNCLAQSLGYQVD